MKDFGHKSIIIPKFCHIFLLQNWVPGMVSIFFERDRSKDHIFYESFVKYYERFVKDFTKIVSTIPFDKEEAILKCCTESIHGREFLKQEKEAFQWLIDVICCANVESKHIHGYERAICLFIFIYEFFRFGI